MKPTKVNEYRESTQLQKIEKIYQNLTDDVWELPIKPAPKKILKQLILTEDDITKNLSDNVIETLQVQDTEGAGSTKIRRDWDMIRREMKTEYNQTKEVLGLVLLDWLDKLGAGLDNTGTSDELKFQATTLTKTGHVEILTRYLNSVSKGG